MGEKAKGITAIMLTKGNMSQYAKLEPTGSEGWHVSTAGLLVSGAIGFYYHIPLSSLAAMYCTN